LLEVIPESDGGGVLSNSGTDGIDSGGGTDSAMFNIAE